MTPSALFRSRSFPALHALSGGSLPSPEMSNRYGPLLPCRDTLNSTAAKRRHAPPFPESPASLSQWDGSLLFLFFFFTSSLRSQSDRQGLERRLSVCVCVGQERLDDIEYPTHHMHTMHTCCRLSGKRSRKAIVFCEEAQVEPPYVRTLCRRWEARFLCVCVLFKKSQNFKMEL